MERLRKAKWAVARSSKARTARKKTCRFHKQSTPRANKVNMRKQQVFYPVEGERAEMQHLPYRVANSVSGNVSSRVILAQTLACRVWIGVPPAFVVVARTLPASAIEEWHRLIK